MDVEREEGISLRAERGREEKATNERERRFVLCSPSGPISFLGSGSDVEPIWVLR